VSADITFTGHHVRPKELFDYKESTFDTIVRDAIPHHASLAGCDHVLKVDHLARVQLGIRMDRAKTAVAVIEQAAIHFARRGIVKGKLQMPIGGMSALGAAVSG